jgi:hypothetical protein
LAELRRALGDTPLDQSTFEKLQRAAASTARWAEQRIKEGQPQ